MPLTTASAASCAILGDSIAQGIAQFRPECHTQARLGVGTAGWLRLHQKQVTADQVVISLGSNDLNLTQQQLLPQLRRVRAQVKAAQVVWILCNQPAAARAAVQQLATEHADAVLDTRPWISTDSVHPRRQGYAALASELERIRP